MPPVSPGADPADCHDLGLAPERRLALGEDPALIEADQRYLAGEWLGALTGHLPIARRSPAQALALSLPLMIGHCRFELGDAAGAIAETPHGATGSRREGQVVRLIRARAQELCRNGQFAVAGDLLALLAASDPPIAEARRECLAPPTGLASPPVASPGGDPPFIRALGLDRLDLAAIRAGQAGRRVLLVHRRFYQDDPSHDHETVATLLKSAHAFGLVVEEFNWSRFIGPGLDPMQGSAILLDTVLRFRPSVIYYDSLFESWATGRETAVREQTWAIFEMARRQLETKIVKGNMDAWLWLRDGPERLYEGLGSAFDLVHHVHPAALGCGTPAQSARTHCYFFPALLPVPAVPRGTVPRACFMGSLSVFNLARLVWWAEAGRLGLPFDFLETRHGSDSARSDQDYADLFHAYQLSVNLTRRTGGPRIITGRTMDALLSGGTLLEEASIDTAFFLAPGLHFQPFEGIAALGAAIDALLSDAERREAMAQAGQRWVRTWFTGDWFWASLLARLDG